MQGQLMVRKRSRSGGKTPQPSLWPLPETAQPAPRRTQEIVPPVDGIIPNDPLAGLTLQIERSTQRRRTISARLEGDRLILQVPAGLTSGQERGWAEKLGGRILAARRKRELNSDDELAVRAQQLNEQFFQGRLRFVSVQYVTNQHHRFGSCTPSRGTIRISDRLAKMPAWVRDAVLVHELAHLEAPDHSARFWALANRYPLMERARGYLMAVGLDDDE
jgi:predicted metal-dependent hydrolase